jgi:XRE family transcriptional regulator, regulator of sulfur utilization
VNEHTQSTGEASSEVRRAIALNMSKMRLARGLSMRELSELTGVSPASLSLIERGLANSTIDVLSKVAAALDLSFTDLTSRYLSDPQIVRADEGVAVRHGSTVVRTIFGSTDRRRFEVSIGTIEPRSFSGRSAHGIGSVEYSFVVSGSVTVETADWTIRLDRGDALRFSAEVDHAYRTAEGPVEVLTLVSSADDWPLDVDSVLSSGEE